MALATRCPHCSTTFRVANDQLKLHAGLVRCGKCQQTFNGVENLVPLDAQGRALSQSLPPAAQDGKTIPTEAVAKPLSNTAAVPIQTDANGSNLSQPEAASTSVSKAEFSPVTTPTNANLAPEPAALSQAVPAASSAVAPSETANSPQKSAVAAAAPEQKSPATVANPQPTLATSPNPASKTPLRPDVWHKPDTARPAAQPSLAQRNTAPEASKESSKAQPRPVAKPIDSARLGDVWAKQAEADAAGDAGSRKLETLAITDSKREPHFSASELEFDLSMPTRQFIDPATAEEWLKLEQASLAAQTNRLEPRLEEPASTAPDRIEPTAAEPSSPPELEAEDKPTPPQPMVEASAGLTDIVAQTAVNTDTVTTDVVTNDSSKTTAATSNDQTEVETVVPAEDQLLAKTLLMDRADQTETVVEPVNPESQPEHETDAQPQAVLPPTDLAESAPATSESDPSQENQAELAEEPDEPGFVLAAERAKRWSRITTVLMSLALILLLPLTLAQMAYTGRNYLVQWYPESKPYLLQACQYLQCQLRLPAQIDYVNIDSHELQAQLPEKNIYSLNLQLQNQSPFAQAWPHVELILHDKREKPVLRKVFTPADYLTPQEMQHAHETGLAAKADANIKLYFEQANTKAAGYHVSIFYP